MGVAEKIVELTADIATFREARDAILGGSQSYSINGRSVARANLPDILKELARLESRLATLNRAASGGSRIKVPLFRA